MTNASELNDGILIIPEGTVDIRDGEYAGRNDIKKLIMPQSLRFIDMEAFCGCEELKEVIFSPKLKSISPACFAECPKLELAKLPPELETVGDGAFLNCVSLRSVVFPDTLTEIGALAYWGTGLEELSIPRGVTSIGEHAFWSCEELRHADVCGKDTVIGDNAFGSCYKLISGYIAPGYPPQSDPPSELLYTLLWCSCPEKHGAEVSCRAESYIKKNEALIMERIFKYNNIPALSGIVSRGLLKPENTEAYVRQAVDTGRPEMTALLLKARGAVRNTDTELEL